MHHHFFKKGSYRKKRYSFGFTMLELLVVLFLFSIIAAIVTPRLFQVYESFNDRLDKDEIVLQLANIGTKVMRRGFGGRISATPPQKNTSPLPYELPQGWKLTPDRDIIWLDNGVCLGGTVHAIKGQKKLVLILERPLCEPKTVYSYAPPSPR